MLEALLNLDASLLLAIQDLRLDWLDPVVAFYTQLGNAGLLWIVLSLSVLCWRPTRRAGALALTAMVLGLLVTNVTIKPLVERTRPWLDLPILPLVVENDPHSFPSGHTCAAFAAGVAWAKTLPWRWGRIGAVLLAVLMGLSRLYVGVHYPTDVLAGALIGTLCAWAALKLDGYRTDRLKENKKGAK